MIPPSEDALLRLMYSVTSEQTKISLNENARKSPGVLGSGASRARSPSFLGRVSTHIDPAKPRTPRCPDPTPDQASPVTVIGTSDEESRGAPTPVPASSPPRVMPAATPAASPCMVPTAAPTAMPATVVPTATVPATTVPPTPSAAVPSRRRGSGTESSCAEGDGSNRCIDQSADHLRSPLLLGCLAVFGLHPSTSRDRWDSTRERFSPSVARMATLKEDGRVSLNRR